MKKVIILFCFFFIFKRTYAQYDTTKFEILWTGTDSILIRKPTKADRLREKGDLKGSLSELKKQIQSDSTNYEYFYNAACLYSMLKCSDSAFLYLKIALREDSSIFILTDPDFYNISKDKRWLVIEKQQLLKEETRTGRRYLHPNITLLLLKINMSDQAYYGEMEIVRNIFGINSPKINSFWRLKKKINKKNLDQLEKIISEFGWPKRSIFGGPAASAAFLVVQHSEIKKQKKYLPLLEKACQEREADWESYALMKDRILMGESKPQIYCSQVIFNEKTKKYELYKLEDEANVDVRRASVGLGPLKEYLSNWGIEFNVPQNK